MSLFKRRLIAGVFIFAFFVLGPLVILYARGYRYAADTQTINGTGTLIISSIPNRATVWLNDEPIQGQTPVTLTALPPRQYAIRLELPGYHAWQKTLSVKQDQATFASNVRLLKNEIPASFVTGDARPLATSDNRVYLLYWKPLTTASATGSLTLLNTNSEQASTLTDRAFLEPTVATWSSNNRYVAVITPSDLLVYDSVFNQLSRAAISEPYQRLRWVEEKLYLFTETDIREATALTSWVPKSSELKTNPTEKVFDIFTQAGNTYVITKQADELKLEIRLPDGPTFDLPFFNNQPFKYLGGWDDILVFQTDRGETQVVRYANGNLFTVLNETFVSALDIDSATQTLSLATGFELWTYSPATDTKTLLTRLGSTVSAVNVYMTSHIIYRTDDEIWAIERDGRDVRGRWKLATLTKADQIFLSGDSAKLFLSGSIGSISGLFRLSL